MRKTLQIIYYVLCALSLLLFAGCLFNFPAFISLTVKALLGILCSLGNIALLFVISNIREEKPVMKHAAPSSLEEADLPPVNNLSLNEGRKMKHAVIKEEEDQKEQNDLNLNEDSWFSKTKLSKIDFSRFLSIPLVKKFIELFIEEKDDEDQPEEATEVEIEDGEEIYRDAEETVEEFTDHTEEQ